MSRPVAVFVTVHNEESFLEKTIQSLISQDFDDFDIIISDNFSTDRTPEIITDYMQQDKKIKLWGPDSFLKSQDHGRWAVNKLNTLDYESSIYLGGHDIVSHNYISALFTTFKANHNAAIVFAEGVEIDSLGRVLQVWPQIPSLYLNAFSKRSNSLTLLFSMIYNIPLFGLWSSRVRKIVPFRHSCIGSDHLWVAEAAVHGDIILEKSATVMTRRTMGAGDLKLYFQKHISDDLQYVTVADDFDKQLDWVAQISDLAQQGAPEVIKNVSRSTYLGGYFLRYGLPNLGVVDGALDYWLNSKNGLLILSQMNNIGREFLNCR